MILKFNSPNDFLLDILYKNPDTDFGLYLKPLRNGVMVGNCVDKHHYEVVFQDTKYSFLQDETQLDFQSFCNPNVILNMLSDLFLHLLVDKNVYWEKEISWLNKSYQEVDNQEFTIEIPNIYLDSNWYNKDGFLLSKYLPQVELTPTVGCNYQLKIKAKSVFEGINLLATVACFIEITNNFKTPYLTEDWFVKYVRILTNVPNIPYFVFYLFIKRCIKSLKVFESIKPTLESYFDNEIQFVFTDTHQTRKDMIFRNLGMDFPILDVGCGELQYFKMFSGKGFKHPYYAVDRAEEVAQLVKKYQENGAEKLLFFPDLADVQLNEKVNIILSEVIEHNTLEETEKVLEAIKKLNFHKIIITTPNRAFNQHYVMNAEFRRPDHVYEMDASEFKTLINKVFGDFNIEISQIGDSIKGISPTQMAIIY
jgi:hypothetical protein